MYQHCSDSPQNSSISQQMPVLADYDQKCLTGKRLETLLDFGIHQMDLRDKYLYKRQKPFWNVFLRSATHLCQVSKKQLYLRCLIYSMNANLKNWFHINLKMFADALVSMKNLKLLSLDVSNIQNCSTRPSRFLKGKFVTEAFSLRSMQSATFSQKCFIPSCLYDHYHAFQRCM